MLRGVKDQEYAIKEMTRMRVQKKIYGIEGHEETRDGMVGKRERGSV